MLYCERRIAYDNAFMRLVTDFEEISNTFSQCAEDAPEYNALEKAYHAAWELVIAHIEAYVARRLAMQHLPSGVKSTDTGTLVAGTVEEVAKLPNTKRYVAPFPDYPTRRKSKNGQRKTQEELAKLPNTIEL